MKRKQNLPVLELCWILLFVLMSFIKTIAQQTKFIEGPEFFREGNHSTWKEYHAPDRTFNNTGYNKTEWGETKNVRKQEKK